MPSRRKLVESVGTDGSMPSRKHRENRGKKTTEAASAATKPYGRVRRDARLCVSNPRSPSKISRGWLKHTRHKIFQASSREYSLNDCFAGSFSRSTNL